MSSLLTKPLGDGPAFTSSENIPDLDYFSGRGAKDTVPLYRTSNADEANILPGLFELLGNMYQRKITPEEFVSYVYGVLAHPDFTARFENELETRELRVPLTKDSGLFEQARKIGARMLWLHTYGERFVPEGDPHGQVPSGGAKCEKAVPGVEEGYPEEFRYNDSTQTLHVGEGEFRPVSQTVYEFEVSGLKVVQSWLKYRMKQGAGRKSSPLDDIRPQRWSSQFTTELLELLWVLEATVEGYPEQAKLLEEIVRSDCFQTDDLPSVPHEMRKPPAVETNAPAQMDFEF